MANACGSKQCPLVDGMVTPWTEREFLAALRAAGWKRMRGPARVYVSPNHVHFNLDECRAETGVLWRQYAARRELPEGLQPWQARLRDHFRAAMEEGGCE